MAKLEEQVVIMMPGGSTGRAEKLVAAIAKDPQYAAVGKIKKSLVFRLAVLQGLDMLEEKYQAKRKKKASR